MLISMNYHIKINLKILYGNIIIFFSETPMGFLPTLEIDGKEVITQNKTIARFAARESGLMPENDFDAALADSVVDSALDLREDHMVELIFGKEENRVCL